MPITSALSTLATALRPRKGEMTRAAIVEAAMSIAAREGLEGLTIGTLADRMDMSKSGVFAHFGSREDLQLAVLKEYVQRFVGQVLKPAVKKPRGLPRLEAILDRWVAFLAREITLGCIMIAGAVEYDDRPGPQRDAMVSIITGWKAELLKAIRQAVHEGHLKRDTDAHQMVFEIYGLMLAMHQADGFVAGASAQGVDQCGGPDRRDRPEIAIEPVPQQAHRPRRGSGAVGEDHAEAGTGHAHAAPLRGAGGRQYRRNSGTCHKTSTR